MNPEVTSSSLPVRYLVTASPWRRHPVDRHLPVHLQGEIDRAGNMFDAAVLAGEDPE